MLKQKIKKILKKCKRIVASALPLRNIIVLQSYPPMTDNTMGVFKEMLARGLNKKYKIVWTRADKSKSLPQWENVSFLDENLLIDRIKFKLIKNTAKCLFSCNDFLTTSRKGQTSFYITHGTPLKSVEHYYNMPENVDYLLVDGEGTREVTARELKCDINKCFALGYPRNDVLSDSNIDLHPLFPQNPDDKIVIWYPTFRQHKNGKVVAASNAIPMLHDTEIANKLNEIAKKYKVLLVLKPHFAQDVSKIKACDLSNIKFINDQFYVDNNIMPYEFIANTDALLTDYSSIYFDYFVCDKPIGLVWEDYEEYKQNNNFALDMDFCMKGGEKIYNLDDFEVFLKNLAENNDVLKAERAEVMKWACSEEVGGASARVTDFVIEKANL